MTKANSLTGTVSKIAGGAQALARKGIAVMNEGYAKLSLSNLSRQARGGVAKPAKIEIYKGKNFKSPSKTVECLYRPTTLALKKTVTWKGEATAERNVPLKRFGGGNAATIDLELFFDTTGTGEDVRTYTDDLMSLVVKENARSDAQPPLCRFKWGQISTFLAYATKCDITYNFFLPDGTPLRATVSMTLNQYLDESVRTGQNPTSLSEARKTWIVTEGDRLDLIAYEEYGNPAHWRHIARVNNIDDPFSLRPGQVLKLTPVDEA